MTCCGMNFFFQAEDGIRDHCVTGVQTCALPIYPRVVRDQHVAHPVDTLRPGDVLITNDPWMTSGQLNDLSVVTPVFRGPRLVGFFGNTCHAIDIGGRGLSADASEVYEEGLAIPILKLYEAGRPNETLLGVIAANVRS